MVFTLNDSLIIDGTGNVGIGTMPKSSFDISSTNSVLTIPGGTTLERVNNEGMFRFNTENELYELFSLGSWSSFALVPSITSVNTQVLKNVDDSLTISGSSLLASTQWRFIGYSKKQYIPKSVTYISDSSIILVRPDVFPVSDAPYQIQCRQMGKVAYFSPITAGNMPIFATPAGLLATVYINTVYTTDNPAASILVQDETGGGIASISISTGSMPSGLLGTYQPSSSNASLIVTGTPTGVADTTYPFILTALDSGNNVTSITYSIKVMNEYPLGRYSTNAVVLGTSGGTSIRKIARDVAGNIYVAGTYIGNPRIYNQGANPTATSYYLPNTTSNRAYLMKFDASGAYVFSFAMNAGTNGEGQNVTIDSLGNIYFSGIYFANPTLFNLTADPNTTSSGFTLPNMTTSGRVRVFLIKWTSLGVYQSSFAFTNEQFDSTGPGLVTDTSNNVYLGGLYYGTPTIWNMTSNPASVSSGYTLTTNNVGYPQAYIIQWNSSGTYVKSVCILPNGTYRLAVVNSLCVDSAQNFYACGGYRGAAPIFNMTASPNTSSTGYSTPDNTTTSQTLFVLKWNSSGTYQSGTAFTGGLSDSPSLFIDEYDNIYVNGASYNNPTIYNMSANPSASSTGYKLPNTAVWTPFLIKWNSSGIYQHSTTLYASTGFSDCWSNDTTVDKAGNIYWAGYYRSSVVLNIYNLTADPRTSSSSYSVPGSGGNTWGFIIRFNSSGNYLDSMVINSSTYTSSIRAVLPSSGKLYVSGHYGGNPTIYNFSANPNSLTSGYSLTSTTNQAAFLIKID